MKNDPTFLMTSQPGKPVQPETLRLCESVRDRMTPLLEAGGQDQILSCKVCKTAVKVTLTGRGSVPQDQTLAAFEKVKAKGGNPSFVWPKNPDFFEIKCCGKLMSNKPIKGTYNKDIPCTPKCTAAKGANCECACGGKNHGGSFA